MLKSITFYSLITLSAVIASQPAVAEAAYPYIGVTAGIPLSSIYKLSDSTGSLDMDSDPGYMAGLSAGIVFDMYGVWNIERIRTEAEFGYRSNKLTKMTNAGGLSTDVNGTVTIIDFMVNGYLENTSMLTSELPVTVFLTAGVGLAGASVSSVTYENTTLLNSVRDTQFAYQGGLGVGYELTNNITLDATYKYMGTSAFNLSGVKAEYGTHNILFGAQYYFK